MINELSTMFCHTKTYHFRQKLRSGITKLKYFNFRPHILSRTVPSSSISPPDSSELTLCYTDYSKFIALLTQPVSNTACPSLTDLPGLRDNAQLCLFRSPASTLLLHPNLVCFIACTSIIFIWFHCEYTMAFECYHLSKSRKHNESKS